MVCHIKSHMELSTCGLMWGFYKFWILWELRLNFQVKSLHFSLSMFCTTALHHIEPTKICFMKEWKYVDVPGWLTLLRWMNLIHSLLQQVGLSAGEGSRKPRISAWTGEAERSSKLRTMNWHPPQHPHSIQDAVFSWRWRYSQVPCKGSAFRSTWI